MSARERHVVPQGLDNSAIYGGTCCRFQFHQNHKTESNTPQTADAESVKEDEQ